jgi:hypothetical protein
MEFYSNSVVLTPQDISMQYTVPVYYSYNANPIKVNGAYIHFISM